ncbi:family 43 glycosylhydrolase [Microlunatus sp. Y2014]|uniref:family 43 glycosylhydrolase n=1 Tax=Microlunatus sp. Y2014 TaxID=3418488 RepID=UPI003DA6D5EB
MSSIPPPVRPWRAARGARPPLPGTYRAQRHLPALIALLCCLTLVLATPTGPAHADPDDPPGTYRNHVMDNLADAFSDPAIIRAKDGYWYAYATQTVMRKDNQGGPWESQYFMPITRSSDLVNWEYVGEVFGPDNHPSWRQFEGTYYWAPEVRYINGLYHLYYSAAGNGDNAIGLATAPTPAGPWTDVGAPVVNRNDAVTEIDPAVFVDTDGQKYLYYGSFRNGGIVAVRLSADGRTAEGPATRVVAPSRGEAPYIVKRDGFYYLFYSGLGCCEREKGAYPVFVGRSTSPMGPFVDAEGVGLNDLHPGGTIVNSPNGNKWVATGHSANVVDKSGQDWILVNGFDRTTPEWGGRPTLMDRLDWIDGWPTVRAGAWSSEERETAPVGAWSVGTGFEDGLGAFHRAGAGQWMTSRDQAAGRYVRSAGRAPEPLFLVTDTVVADDVRVEADLRLRGEEGRTGLVIGWTDAANHVVAWLDRTDGLVVEVTENGTVTQRKAATVHADADLTTWHAVTAQVRDGQALVELSQAMLGTPLATVELEVPTLRTAGGVAATHGAGEADNVGVTELYTPVTEKQPDPEVGPLLPAYSEEFDDDELTGWEWFGPADGEVVDGTYVWPTQNAAFNGNPTMASALLRDAPEGTYTVEAKLHLPITDAAVARAQAGIIAFRSPADSIHLAPSRVGLSRQVLLWIGRDNDAWPEMQMGPSADTMWLRLRHTVNPDNGEHQYQVATSRDGENYIWGGIWTMPAGENPRIGMVSLGGEGLTATFHHVRFYGA